MILSRDSRKRLKEMSRKIFLSKLSDDERVKLSKDLRIEKPKNRYAWNAAPVHIYPISVSDDTAYLPFSYNRNLPLPERNNLPSTDYKFKGKLRDNQKKVKREVIDSLNKTNSAIIAAYPGFGKCLGKNTPVMLYNGDIKNVQDIEITDLLMGDDSRPRRIFSVCKGREKMYRLTQDNGISFTMNESHILSLKIPSHKNIFYNEIFNRIVVKYFDFNFVKFCFKHFEDLNEALKFKTELPNTNTIDISVKDYLALPLNIQKGLKTYKVGVEFSSSPINLDPYITGVKLMENHFREELYGDKILEKKYKRIPIEYLYNDRKIRLKFLLGMIDSIEGCSGLDEYTIRVRSRGFRDDIIFLARSLGFVSLYEKVSYDQYVVTIKGRIKPCILPIEIDSLSVYNPWDDMKEKNAIESLSFDFSLESIGEGDYYGFTINGNGRFLLGDFTVTHNTCTAINIASRIKLKTMIIAHRIVLINQWIESIQKFCSNATVQVIETDTKIEDRDFYIMNPINVPKRSRNTYEDIGFVIVDECHNIVAEKMSESLLYLCPRYILGLSATPYRTDGLDLLLDLYFGTKKICRKLWHPHVVYTYETNLTPSFDLNKQGKVNWNSLLQSQCEDIDRNEIIIRMVKFFPKKTILILSKRVAQVKYLKNRLKEEKINVASLVGSEQKFDRKVRVLVGTSSKCGVGFDHSSLNMLILASDLEQYFIQFLGRVFRREDCKPVIIDILDNHPILKRHYQTRKSVYLEHGGVVKNFKTIFPEF